MYIQVRGGLPAASETNEVVADQAPPVSRNVVMLGVTSLFTDISSEMVATVLPLYLLFYLRVSGLQLGAIDGLYQGVSALVRIWGGTTADRTGRHKEVAFAGYALSAVSRLGLVLAGPAMMPLLGAVVADRIGKGIRTAPRDALISLSTPPGHLGRAFGVHRALDTIGAMVGPLVSFGLLALLPGRFDVIFVTSLLFGAMGLVVLGVLVRNRRGTATVDRPDIRSLLGPLALPRFRILLAASAGLGLVTISDAFVYVTLQRRLSFNAGYLPLLYVATSAIYFLFAIPAGRLADRVGRVRILLAGYVALILVYVTLLVSVSGILPLILGLVAFGCYYACTDGVMAALVSASLPDSRRSSGLALQGTAAAVAALAGSVVFGAIWTLTGPRPAVAAFLIGLLVLAPIAGLALWRAGAFERDGQPA